MNKVQLILQTCLKWKAAREFSGCYKIEVEELASLRQFHTTYILKFICKCILDSPYLLIIKFQFT